MARQGKWSAQAIEAIGKLMLEGLTATQIGAEFGVTRNTIIGIAHRHLNGSGVGFARRNSGVKRVKAPRTRLFFTPRMFEGKPYRKPEPEPVEIVPLKISLLELTSSTCKFPIGDPQHEDFGFCGHPAKTGRIYCAFHHRLAYSRSESRTDARGVPA